MIEADLGRLAAIILAGIIAGWFAGLVTRGSGFGLWGNTMTGLIGAAVGYYLLNAIGISLGGGVIGAALTALIGAFATLAVIGRMRR